MLFLCSEKSHWPLAMCCSPSAFHVTIDPYGFSPNHIAMTIIEMDPPRGLPWLGFLPWESGLTHLVPKLAREAGVDGKACTFSS